MNFGSKFLTRHTQCTMPLCTAHIASDFTCVYCADGTIFGTTDLYELGFSYLSLSIFRVQQHNEYFFNNKQKTMQIKTKYKSLFAFLCNSTAFINCQVPKYLRKSNFLQIGRNCCKFLIM